MNFLWQLIGKFNRYTYAINNGEEEEEKETVAVAKEEEEEAIVEEKLILIKEETKMLPKQPNLLRRNSKRFVIGDETEDVNEKRDENKRIDEDWNRSARFLTVGTTLT